VAAVMGFGMTKVVQDSQEQLILAVVVVVAHQEMLLN
jgi:hypothetical protein